MFLVPHDVPAGSKIQKSFDEFDFKEALKKIWASLGLGPKSCTILFQKLNQQINKVLKVLKLGG